MRMYAGQFSAFLYVRCNGINAGENRMWARAIIIIDAHAHTHTRQRVRFDIVTRVCAVCKHLINYATMRNVLW